MVVIVTGAAGGMGRAVAHRLGRDAELIVTDVNPAGLDDLVESLQAEGVSVRALPGDLTSPRFIDELVAAAGGALDALVNTAGVWNPAIDAARTFEINYLPTVLLLEKFLPLARPGTVAVSLASTGGHRRGHATQIDNLLSQHRGHRAWAAVERVWGSAIEAHTAYGIAKRGVVLECEAHAHEWAAKGARVVSISPGNFDTPMGALGTQSGKANFLVEAAIGNRPGKPDEIADLVEFLRSPRAAYITGCDIRIDGGAIASSRHSAPSDGFAIYDSQLVPPGG